MGAWVAIAYGALDLTGLDLEVEDRCAVLSTLPSLPVFLRPDAEALWRRLLAGPLDDAELDLEQRELLAGFADFGIASDDVEHPNRFDRTGAPWLSSFAHELVYALVANVARECEIRIVAIKGPALHSQGLRRYEHSGDVDVLVDPSRADELVAAMRPWGWKALPTMWSGTRVKHGVTLLRPEWGCEIDVHWRMPGWAMPDEAAFEEVFAHSAPIRYAGVEVEVPDRPTHAVISALHLARPQFAGGARVAAAARDVLVSAGVEVLEAARALHADAALMAELREAFPDEKTAPDYPPPKDWTWRVHDGAVGGNLAALRSLPWRQRPRIVFRLLWPSPPMLADWLDRYDVPSRGPVRDRLAWLGRIVRRARH